MKLEKGKISSSQLMYLMTGFILGSTLLLSFVAPITKQNTWIAILFGGAAGLILVYITSTLAMKFPEKNLVLILETVYGRYVGKIISVLYILFFWMLITFNVKGISDFFVTLIMPETPDIVFIIIIVLLCGYAVSKGLEVIARTSLLLVSIFIIEVILIFILLYKNLDFTNLLPIFDISLSKLVQGVHTITAIPFGETVVFLFITGYVSKIEKARKASLSAVVIGIVIFIIISIRNVGVLGNSCCTIRYPSYQAARLIEVGNILERMELLLAISHIAIIFFKITIYYYATTIGVAQVLNLRSNLPLVYPIGIISVIISSIIFVFHLDSVEIGTNTFPIFSLPFVFFIPLVTLIIVNIKEKNKKKGNI